MYFSIDAAAFSSRNALPTPVNMPGVEALHTFLHSVPAYRPASVHPGARNRLECSLAVPPRKQSSQPSLEDVSRIRTASRLLVVPAPHDSKPLPVATHD